MDFEQALEYMQGRLRLGVKLGNERFSALLERLGNPQDSLKVVHIAGTKGKGSTTAIAGSILQAAGYKVGMYLSPFVYDVRERVQINGQMISREDFARWVTAIRPHIEELEHTELGPVTEFELKTAVGLCYFAEQRVDYAVIEVGLGGRLDATNVIPKPLVTVITNIGLDHMDLLGYTHAEIAREKAGIVKPGIPCVTGVPEGSEAYAEIDEICKARNAPLIRVSPNAPSHSSDCYYRTEFDGTLTIRTERRQIRGTQLRLRGVFQHANAAAAVAALDAIAETDMPALPDDVVRLGLSQAYLPGRLEKISDRPTIVLDVAHNELSAQALANALLDEFNAANRQLILVAGLSKGHAPEPFLKPLIALKPILIATQPNFHPRDAEEVAAAARKYGLEDVTVIASSVSDAVRHALALAAPSDIICVTGSFYTVGDVPPTIWNELLLERNRPLCHMNS